MNKIIATAVLATILSFNANCQLDKGNWLVGGTVSYISFERTDNVGSSFTKSTSFLIDGRIGYFFLNKTCIGLIPELLAQTFTTGSGSTTSGYTTFGGGPFLRQYLLQTDKQLNIFGELGYLFINSHNKDAQITSSSTKFLARVGVCYFLNSSVAIELGINYSNHLSKFENQRNNLKQTQFSIGLQFHLEKK